MTANITEQGNGLPGNGELVYDAREGILYRIVTPDADIRHRTGRAPGAGMWARVEVEPETIEPAELTEAEWDAVSDCGVHICDDD